ncbi:MAG: hypothetical protein U0744_16330 [Gemmataceae bacterium]
MRAAWILALASCIGLAGLSVAQPPFGKGKQANDPAFVADRDLFHYLLDHREKIRRTVKKLEDGVETVTESDDAAVAAKIREHVASMKKRVEENRPIHRRDPLFDAIFHNAEKIVFKQEKTPEGVRVRETSKDPYVAKLLQAHAEVVSRFLANGHAEVMKNHELPKK